MVDSITASTVLTASSSGLSSSKNNKSPALENPALEQNTESSNSNPAISSPLEDFANQDTTGIQSVLDQSSNNNLSALITSQNEKTPVEQFAQENTSFDPIANLQQEDSGNLSALKDIQNSRTGNSAITGASSPIDTLREFIGGQNTSPGSFVDIEI